MGTSNGEEIEKKDDDDVNDNTYDEKEVAIFNQDKEYSDSGEE